MRQFNLFLFVFVILATVFSHITVFADESDESIYDQETYNFSDYSDSNDSNHSVSNGYGDYDRRSFSKGTHTKRQPTTDENTKPLKWEDETQVAELSSDEIRNRNQANAAHSDDLAEQTLSVKLKRSK